MCGIGGSRIWIGAVAISGHESVQGSLFAVMDTNCEQAAQAATGISR